MDDPLPKVPFVFEADGVDTSVLRMGFNAAVERRKQSWHLHSDVTQ